VVDYYASFTELANQSYEGLILELKREVISGAPPSLLQVVPFAKLFEEKFHPSSLALKHKFPYFPAKSLTKYF